MDPVEAIRARYAHYGPTEKLKERTAVADIRTLLGVIDTLREADPIWWEPALESEGS